MSQVSVERIIGLLATDESLRDRFSRSPHDALRKMLESGVELTALELRSLASLDPGALKRFAETIDPRLQKTGLEGGGS